MTAPTRQDRDRLRELYAEYGRQSAARQNLSSIDTRIVSALRTMGPDLLDAADELERVVGRLEVIIRTADLRAASSLSRDINGRPFRQMVPVDDLRAIIATATTDAEAPDTPQAHRNRLRSDAGGEPVPEGHRNAARPSERHGRSYGDVTPGGGRNAE